jgi:predicted site-specific integrase-resolvase
MTTTTVDGWLSPAQAAHRLCVTPQTVGIYCRQGKLRCIETPLGRLIDPASVDQLAQERADSPPRCRRGRRTAAS